MVQVAEAYNNPSLREEGSNPVLVRTGRQHRSFRRVVLARRTTPASSRGSPFHSLELRRNWVRIFFCAFISTAAQGTKEEHPCAH